MLFMHALSVSVAIESLGPAIALGAQKGSWTAFELFDMVWSVGGWGDELVNEFPK